MEKRWLSGCFIPPLILVAYSVNGVDATTNPKISTNSASQYRSILSRLKTLPCENLSESIKNYDNEFNSNFFADIIVIAENSCDVFPQDQIDTLIQDATVCFCFYVKNLEDPDNANFKQNEQKIKTFMKTHLDKLINSLNEEDIDTSQKNIQKGTFWMF